MKKKETNYRLWFEGPKSMKKIIESWNFGTSRDWYKIGIGTESHTQKPFLLVLGTHE